MTHNQSMEIKPIESADEATGQLRLKEIYRRQRIESGGETSLVDLLAETEITTRLFDLEYRFKLKLMEDIVATSVEAQM